MSAKVLGDTGVLYTDRRDFYIDPQVVKELWTDVAPFTTVISNRETRQTNDPIFKMFEHRNPWIKQTFMNNGDTDNLNDAVTTEVDVTISDHVNLASPDDSWLGLQCEVRSSAGVKKAIVLITSVTNATTIGVKCLWNKDSTNTAMANDDVFTVIGNAHGEGTVAPKAWADELKTVWNSTQIFKTPLEITGTLLQASLRGESSELARLRAQKNQEHKMQKEKAFLFGARLGGTGLSGSADSFADGGMTDANSNKVRTTYGIVSAIENYGNSASGDDDQNIFSISTTSGSETSYGDFVDMMEKVFQYVPTAGVKRAFCGAGALGYWSKLGGAGSLNASGWTVNIGDMKRDSLGFNYRTLETPHGLLQLIPTPALRGDYNKTMLVVDEDNLFHAQYRAPMFQANIKTEDAYDGVKDQYFSDEGIGISLQESHSIFTIN